MQSLTRIKSHFGDYEVSFGDIDFANELSDSDLYKGIIVDKSVYEIYPNVQQLASRNNLLVLEAVEATKEYHSLSNVFEWFSANKFDRSSRLLAIGGGVIQDVATFTSNVFHRGFDWDFVPTTLLSQSDSCIGGKCGINVGDLKNQIGSVYPPKSIFLDFKFVNTLSDLDLICGLGEILKMSLTGNGQFWESYQLATKEPNLKNYDWDLLVKKSIGSKKYVVEIDEMEQDFRRVLNYGHTMGHAIEAASEFQIPHGVAVLMGMKAANAMGNTLGITPARLSQDVGVKIDELLQKLEISTHFNIDSALEKIKHDKKKKNGLQTFIILEEVGVHRFVSLEMDNETIALVRDSFESLH
jgi:3-dehydroquinate synthase